MARIVTVLTRSLPRILSAVSLAVLVAALHPSAARAAGFLLQEQTGRGLGTAFAGESAYAIDPATVYYNPAGMVLIPGTQFATSGFLIYGRVHFNNNGSRFAPGTIEGGDITGNLGGNGLGVEALHGTALVPTFFLTHQFTDRFSAGLGISTPFGLETNWDQGWIGRYHARLSRLKTLNINPSFAFRVLDWLSIGAGVDVEWAFARLTNNIDMGTICQQGVAASGFPPSICLQPPLSLRPGRDDGYVRVQGDDWKAGWNMGLLFMPSDRTRIGLSYRSRIEHALHGDANFNVPPKAAPLSEQTGALVDTDARAVATLPDRASISLFQRLTDDLDFLADVTWTNWSLFDELVIEFANPAQPNVVQPENWKDSMRYALGLVYRLDEMWTFRTGFAYDESPIANSVDRTPRIPDADRYWLALGVGIRPTSRIRLDLSYAHIFSPRSTTTAPDPTTGARLIGSFDSAADLFAFQITYDVDWTFSDPLGTGS